MKHYGLGLICLLLVTVIFTGCTDDLAEIDLSGTVQLAAKSKGWPYRIIDQKRFRRTPLSLSQWLVEYRSDLELHRNLTINGEEYNFKADFSQPGKKFNLAVGQDGFKQPVDLVVLNRWEEGDHWNSALSYLNRRRKGRELERSGEIVASFFQAKSGIEFMVAAKYRLDSEVEWEADPRWGQELEVEGASFIKLGNHQCLYGEKLIAGTKISFYVLDWNLDGRFSETDDLVWCDYIRQGISFNEVVRLTDSWKAAKDNWYQLGLEQTADGSFQLVIELVAKGESGRNKDKSSEENAQNSGDNNRQDRGELEFLDADNDQQKNEDSSVVEAEPIPELAEPPIE